MRLRDLPPDPDPEPEPLADPVEYPDCALAPRARTRVNAASAKTLILSAASIGYALFLDSICFSALLMRSVAG